MSQPGSKTQEKPSVATREKSRKARRYQVVLLNDDYTTMEFVVMILESIFRHSPAEAVQIMLKVHKEGRGVAGVYPHEVAESKSLAVHDRERAAGFPLRAAVEEI